MGWRGETIFNNKNHFIKMISLLCIDDEQDPPDLCKLYLEWERDFSVDHAHSAQEGLEKIRTGTYDAVISDYQMPDMDGIELLRQVRAGIGNLPFILFAGKGHEEVAIAAINHGGDFFINKNGDARHQMGELALKIRQAVRQYRAEETPHEMKSSNDPAAIPGKYGELDRFFTRALDLLCIMDHDSNFRLLNPAWESLTGYPLNDLIGKKSLDFVHPDDLTMTHTALKNLMGGGNVAGLVNRCRIADGTYRWLEWRLSPSGSGLIYSAARDITERRRAEEAQILANKKLNLLSDITRHDIRNQLTVFSGYLTLLRQQDPKPPASTYIQKLLDTTKTIAAQVEFTKLYQNLGIAAPDWQDVSNIFFRVCTQIDLQKVRIDLEVKNLEIYADPLLERTFYNLVDNAIRYGEQVTAISVSALETDEGLTLTIRDDGVGISPGDKDKVFNRGFGKNTGLGLFLAREILSITGITIQETGEYLHGARFDLSVPKGMYRSP
jgi:PAS domain S-box-containing protein